MERNQLIGMLNKDLAEEHAAIIRYLVHSYQEGEDTVMGASLLSRSREEMWHMHWLGMIIGRLGGEPDFAPAVYPFDPTNRATMLKSYIAYEEKLIPHYNSEADKVSDPHIKRVLLREAWESAIHARRFQRLLDKLDKDEAHSLPGGSAELPKDFLERLQRELADKYREMLQHIRTSWVFQKEESTGWELMNQAMEKMKHLALFTEAVAEDGAAPRLIPTPILSKAENVKDALIEARTDLEEKMRGHKELLSDGEFRKHGGLVVKLDLALQQEEHQCEEIGDWLKS
ncbi:MAG: ferritin-like domain-containing protein [Deltaproteobacteria bacterium]|nr:ferritin-like domain-containing protein [Deltaproteobacteria bacterium]